MRLFVVVEGQSEEDFVRRVLAPHLLTHGVYAAATIVGKQIANARGHTIRGGGQYRNWRRDLVRVLGTDRSGRVRVTTLFDLYGLPEDFPGLAEHGADRDTQRRCDALQSALADDLGDWRLVPYIQRHEFEALVLAALPALADWLDAADDLAGLETLRSELADSAPEDVNDGRTTAPSKRLLAHVPGYRKTLHGPAAIEDAGLAAVRALCPRFDAWVRALEALAGPADENPTPTEEVP